MGKPLIVYSNVPAFKEWPTNFKLLFLALSTRLLSQYCGYHVLHLIRHSCTIIVVLWLDDILDGRQQTQLVAGDGDVHIL